MFDGYLRPLIVSHIDRVGKVLALRGVSANQVTIASFSIGIVAAVFLSQQFYVLGLILLLLSRLGDGLDGAIARASQKTDFGGFLDIVLDFGFYGGIPLGFVLAEPALNAVPGAVLLLSFYVNGASFLAFAIMAEKHKLTENAPASKSIFFSTGLAEATETYAVFVASCLFPAWFPLLAYGFAAVCFYTALSRIMLARRLF